jgi:glycosyltransferase involved in cell wall biosynthesis
VNGSPEVSVVIPTRDRRRFLPLTLDAALGQEEVAVEVIVVDDASADGTAAMLARLDEPRLRVLRHATSRGVAAARNAGLWAARGEWVAFLDDDDLWSPRKLRTQLDAAAAHDASFVYSASVIIDEHGHAIEPDYPPPSPSDLLAFLLAINPMPASGSNVVAQADLVRRLGGLDERARFDDWDLWIRLAAAARAASCPEALIGYRMHPSNRILTTQSEALPGIRYLAEKHRALSLRHGVEFDVRECLHWVAWAHRRGGEPLKAARICLATALRYRAPGDLARAALVPFGEWAIYSWRPRAARLVEPDWLAAYR